MLRLIEIQNICYLQYYGDVEVTLPFPDEKVDHQRWISFLYSDSKEMKLSDTYRNAIVLKEGDNIVFIIHDADQCCVYLAVNKSLSSIDTLY